jgi:hypothetical protein
MNQMNKNHATLLASPYSLVRTKRDNQKKNK